MERTGEALEHADAALSATQGFVPAVVARAHALKGIGKPRRAHRHLEEAFGRGPHPDLARAYLDLRTRMIRPALQAPAAARRRGSAIPSAGAGPAEVGDLAGAAVAGSVRPRIVRPRSTTSLPGSKRCRRAAVSPRPALIWSRRRFARRKRVGHVSGVGRPRHAGRLCAATVGISTPSPGRHHRASSRRYRSRSRPSK